MSAEDLPTSTWETLDMDEDGAYIFPAVAFFAFMRCQNLDCSKMVSICGDSYRLPEIEADWDDAVFNRVYWPHFIYPAPHVFVVPANCPEEITAEIYSAFLLFWCEPNAAASRIRSSIELLMRHLKIDVPKASLHKKLERYRSMNNDLAEKLLAVKLLGNIGVHSRELDDQDLLDAFEVLAYVIEKLFRDPEQRRRRATEIARKINQKRGRGAS